jgi:hypothetical protein
MTILTATNIDFSCAGKVTNCNWTLRNYGGSQELRGATYGKGVYVVVGDSISMTSVDAITWASNSINGYMYDVAFGNGTFVAVGLGRILTSSDGLVWTNRNFGGAYWLTRVAFGNGTFVAVGEGGGGTILTSTDGILWKKRITLATPLLTGVTYGNGTFVVTANDGKIYQSAPVSIPNLTAGRDAPSGGIALTLAGEIGRDYLIQFSTNMANPDWQDFLTFTNTAPTMEFLDRSVTNLSQRFYRAVSP